MSSLMSLSIYLSKETGSITTNSNDNDEFAHTANERADNCLDSWACGSWPRPQTTIYFHNRIAQLRNTSLKYKIYLSKLNSSKKIVTPPDTKTQTHGVEKGNVNPYSAAVPQTLGG